MNELMILNEENNEVKTYALYYTINERFYVIYTAKEKDENNYVILHIAKVLKEVNNTEEGIVPTGKYIGLEISDQSEWDNAKVNIGEIVSNKQNNTPTSVSYLPVNEISGISIKSSKTFKLREDVVDSIIVAAEPAADEGTSYVLDEVQTEEVAQVEPTVTEEVAPVEMPLADIAPAIAPVEIPEPVAEEVAPVEPVVAEEPAIEESAEIATPALAPNPFEMQPEVEIPEPVVAEEPAPINPYEVMQQQRAEAMINDLANDNMQDIVATPVISVSELENKVAEEPVAVEPVVAEEPVSTSVFDAQPVAVEENDVVVMDTTEKEAVVTEEPVAEEVAPVAEEPKEEVITSESFVDSIVADVSDILDKKEEQTPEEKEDYERLYNDALEKTVELEKELAELHSKLNNIKNIIE